MRRRVLTLTVACFLWLAGAVTAQTLPEKPQAKLAETGLGAPVTIPTLETAHAESAIARLPERPRPNPPALLRGLTYATAVLDAESTTRLRQRAEAHSMIFHETNPFARPFASRRVTMYGFSIGGAVMTDLLGRKLSQSDSPKLRRLRWLPYAVIIGANIWGVQSNLREMRKHRL